MKDNKQVNPEVKKMKKLKTFLSVIETILIFGIIISPDPLWDLFWNNPNILTFLLYSVVLYSLFSAIKLIFEYLFEKIEKKIKEMEQK